jgi:hypothetical protein
MQTTIGTNHKYGLQLSLTQLLGQYHDGTIMLERGAQAARAAAGRDGKSTHNNEQCQ